MARKARAADGGDGLAVRAAWLHYAAGLTQAEVAAKLGVSSAKAHRLITRANQIGAVKVSIDGAVSECLELEGRLTWQYGLDACQVVPELDEAGLPLRALGVAGADFLRREVERSSDQIIGIGHGRTLAAAIDAMPGFAAEGVQFVSLLGGLTRNFAANPYDVMHSLAAKTGAAAYVIPVPFFANSVGDRDVLLAQNGIRDVMQMGARADLMVVGIGTAQPDAQLVSSRMIEADEINEVETLGGVGELLGHFFDVSGRPIQSALAARTVSPALETLAGRRVVALAGGPSKIEGIRSVLMSGYLTGLITDERTAMALIA